MTSDVVLTKDEELAIQREILACSKRMYDYQAELREGIDKKAQLFLSLLTFLIGSALLSSTFWGLIARFRSAGVNIAVQLLVYFLWFALLIAIPCSFALLLIALSPQPWNAPLPPRYYSHLFDRNSEYRTTTSHVVSYAASGYALAAELFREGTRKKSRSLVWGSRLTGLVLALFFLIATIMAAR